MAQETYRREIEDIIIELGRHRDPRVRELAKTLWELFINYAYNVEETSNAMRKPGMN